MITTNGCLIHRSHAVTISKLRPSKIGKRQDRQISDKANKSDIQCFVFFFVRIPKKDIICSVPIDRRRHFQPCSTRPHTRGIDVIKFWVLYRLITRTPSLTLVPRCIKVRVVWGVIRYSGKKYPTVNKVTNACLKRIIT